MKYDRLTNGGIFNGKCEDIYSIIIEYLVKLREENPSVFIFPDNYQKDGKEIARGFIKEEMPWPQEDVSYGHFQLIPLFEDLDSPIQVALFCSEPKYGRLWNDLFGMISSKFVVFNGILPPDVKPWELIPDKSNHREILCLWHEGLTDELIAARLRISKDTVYDLLRRLRQDFGEIIVPHHQSWRKKK